MTIPVPKNEAERVAALHSYNILDSAPEVAYEEIAELAARICECPVATIGMIDERRHWAKSRYGLPADEKPRELSICSTAICKTTLLIVPDLSSDERFSDLPTVSGEPHFRFYCGAPLINSEGIALGTICVMDFKPRQLSFEQTEALRSLSHQVMAQLELRRKLIELEEVRQRLERAHKQVEAEKTESDRLLLNILPAGIAEELKQHGQVRPRYYESATILFVDFVGFTRFAETMEPNELVQQLDQYFSQFDEITDKHRLEKLKTIGDAYMCVGGLPAVNRSHPVDTCLAALEIRDYVDKMNRKREKLRLPPWEIRLGIHTGPVIAGVVGSKKFTYDVWGDAVNVAARFESDGAVGKINISEYTHHLVKDVFDVEPASESQAKNKGLLSRYLLNRIKPDLSSDTEGVKPKAAFMDSARMSR